MACFRPRSANRSLEGEVRMGVGEGRAFQVPCGKCIGCRLDRSRMWTVRCAHEARLWDRNLFVTLTYDDEHLPAPRCGLVLRRDRLTGRRSVSRGSQRWKSLEYVDVQLFLKRLRNELPRPLRFFCGGEYGDLNKRPHWHLILFNAWLPDLVEGPGGRFASKLLEATWGKGRTDVGMVTTRSVAYVAGYVRKKAYGRAAREAYEDVLDWTTGELWTRSPEISRMSKGIGRGWFERYVRDFLPNDFSVLDGVKYKVPRYYLEMWKAGADPATVEALLEARYERASERRWDSTPERLAVREEYAVRKEAQCDRKL